MATFPCWEEGSGVGDEGEQVIMILGALGLGRRRTGQRKGLVPLEQGFSTLTPLALRAG